ncbi:MAG: thioesterase family protein [Gammaproteobacteria bacterium]|nr:thioesterase family protein [Gammaproteobacteria bacterium]
MLRVTAAEIDDLGHVNNARFLEYFERGRRDWYNQCASDLHEAAGGNVGTVVVNINVNFRRECFEGDLLSVTTSARSRGRRSFVFGQEISNEAGEVVADASVTNVLMNMDTREVVSLPESLARHFDS